MENVDQVVRRIREQVTVLRDKAEGKLQGTTPEFRREIVITFQKTKMKSREFCQAIGISCSSLTQWKKAYLLGNKSSKQIARASFKRLQVQESAEAVMSATGQRLMIEGPRGLRIIGVTASDIATIWKALC